MVELDRTINYNRVKLFSGILKKNVDTESYSSYLELNKIKDLSSERKIRAELKQRGYTLRANLVFKAISNKQRIRELIKNLIS